MWPPRTPCCSLENNPTRFPAIWPSEHPPARASQVSWGSTSGYPTQSECLYSVCLSRGHPSLRRASPRENYIAWGAARGGPCLELPPSRDPPSLWRASPREHYIARGDAHGGPYFELPPSRDPLSPWRASPREHYIARGAARKEAPLLRAKPPRDHRKTISKIDYGPGALHVVASLTLLWRFPGPRDVHVSRQGGRLPSPTLMVGMYTRQ